MDDRVCDGRERNRIIRCCFPDMVLPPCVRTLGEAIAKDPERSLNFLVKAGIVTADGKLTPEYDIPNEQAHINKG